MQQEAVPNWHGLWLVFGHGVMQCPLEQPDIAQLKTPPTITPEMLGGRIEPSRCGRGRRTTAGAVCL